MAALLLRKVPLFVARGGGRRLLQPSASYLVQNRALSEDLRIKSYKDVGVKVGDVLHGFRVKDVMTFESLQISTVDLVHEATNARYLHVCAEEPNNVFSVGFRTPTESSNGVPHILEHTTLCGSEKYPCRDPFFKMVTRSLATFMNAWTATDYTMYPFSTVNRKDYDNLLRVYLDATFFPRLERLDFLQEGWRIERENPREKSGSLQVKGVVFNEMKGVFSSIPSLYHYRSSQALFPNSSYQHISGGEPLNIPDLSHEELRQFHATHYHPSNSLFCSFGDIPLTEHLQAVSALALQKFSKSAQTFSIKPQARWSEPRTVRVAGPYDSSSPRPTHQTRASVAFLTNPPQDAYESFVVNVLAYLMVNGPETPFYKALILSGLGTDFTPNTGYDRHSLPSSFAVGLQGLSNEDDGSKLLETVMNTFETLHKSGFDQQDLDGVLHQIELSLRKRGTNFGLGVASGLTTTWVHGGEIRESLDLDSHLARFRRDTADPAFLKGKIAQYFLDNPHRLLFVMNPDEKYNENEAAKEKAKIDKMLSELSESEVKRIEEDGVVLAQKQDTKEDVSVLPTLTLDDVRAEGAEYVLALHCVPRGISVPPMLLQTTVQPTNQVVYFNGIALLPSFPPHLVPYLPLFSMFSTSLGAGSLDHMQFAQQVKQHTGGLSLSPHLSLSNTTPDQFELGLMLSSHSLARKTPNMAALWRMVLDGPNFANKEYMKTLIAMNADEMLSSLADNGHSMAALVASSSMNSYHETKEKLSGLSQLELLQRIVRGDVSLDDVADRMREIATIAFNLTHLRCSLVSDEGSLPDAQKEMLGMLGANPAQLSEVKTLAGSLTPSVAQPIASSSPPNLFIETSFLVNYVGQCHPGVSYTHPHAPQFNLLSSLLTSKFLHREIREKGGAYGGGAVSQNGLFRFYSYRDPNPLQTLDAFTRSLDWARNKTFSEEDLVEAKLSVFQRIDAPVSPGARGLAHFTDYITYPMRRKWREALLRTTSEDIANLVNQYFPSGNTKGHSAVMGGKSFSDKFRAMPGWGVKKVSLEE